jgi:hypothetical protein
LPADESAKGFIDLTNEKPDGYCQMKLNNLKHQLHDTLKQNYFTYDTNWEDISTGKADLKSFADKVFQDISSVLVEQTNDMVKTDGLQYEIQLHEEFKNRLTENFIGRRESLKQIKDYLNDSSENKVLSVIGDSGSGKSSLIAQAIKNVEAEIKNTKLFYRFIGISSQTTNTLSFLISLSVQIAKAYNTSLEELAGEGKDIYSIQGITEVFKKCLMLATADNPIVLFIDALDQFSENSGGMCSSGSLRNCPIIPKWWFQFLPVLASQLKDTKTMLLPVYRPMMPNKF